MLPKIKSFIKMIVSKIQKKHRVSNIKNTSKHLTSDDISNNLKRMGIENGDILFIHSSLKSLGYVEGGANAVIEGLMKAVGSNGTLLLPTYYMPAGTILGTCQLKDYIFDPKVHGTTMGALPEAFLATPGVLRSIHPTHSVSAIGKYARFLTEAHHVAPSVFGSGSPWQRFHELNGKVLGLGVSMGPVTFYHLLEDTIGERFPLDVWEAEKYQIPSKDYDGNIVNVPVRPYKPDVTMLRIDQKSRADLRDYFKNEFIKANLLHEGKVGESSAWFINAKDFLSHLEIMASYGITIYSPPSQIEQLTSMSTNGNKD